MQRSRWLVTLWMAAQLVCASAMANEAPEVEAIPIYRSYPDYPIRIEIPASDTDSGAEGELSFSSAMLPEGSTLDASLGVFEWTPDETQLGAYVIPITVTDMGDPALTSESEIPIKVVQLDMCTVPVCDLATGCENVLLPISELCCGEPPEIRVPDPEADCESGAIVHLGRNITGFGRLHNCDLFQIHTVQSGVRARVHIETRCLDTSSKLKVEERLEAHYVDSLGVERDILLYDRTPDEPNLQLFDRGDGWAQRLSQVRTVIPPDVFSDLEGADALYTIVATDSNGVVATEQLRLILKLETEPPELPDPSEDTLPEPNLEPGCESCHRPYTDGPGSERAGIEDVHPWQYIPCVDCHGGDVDANTIEEAHVPNRKAPEFLKNLSSDRLDKINQAYLRFINPGDLRVANESCGLAGCHPQHVAKVKLSVMSTYAGHYTLPRYLVGEQDRNAIHAAVDVVDPNFDPATAPAGAIESFSALREVDSGADRSTLSSVMDTYLPKACPTCHLNAFGENKADGTYRSSGCTACHMVYADNGISLSEDPVIEKGFAPHPIKHELTSAIPVEQCSHCHFQGGRIGLAYRGIREGGFPPEATPARGTTLGESIYGHDPDFFFVDEDDQNPNDETPPDLHYDAGMVCVDCHVGGDVHGDGNLYRSERYQTGIRCEDCHGSVRAAIEEDPADGLFKNSKGDPLKRLERAGRAVLLTLAMDPNEKLYVPQIYELLEAKLNPRMVESMGVDENGFSHTDSIECYACHTSWRQTCFGCHITVDDSATALNHTTGKKSSGLTSATRDGYSLNFFTLGINERGKLSPLCSSMSVFLSYIDENGVQQYRDQPRTSYEDKKGFGWNPFHHHTVSLASQPCARCHPAGPGEPDNSAMLAATYGFGAQTVMVMDGNSEEHDLSQFLDARGNLISDFPHPNTGPVPAAMRRRALAIPEASRVLQGGAALVAITALARNRRRLRWGARNDGPAHKLQHR